MDDVKIGEILGPADEDTTSRRERRVRRDFWKTVRKAARRIPFMEELVAAYFCALDPKTPTRVRGILIAALAYFVLPLDMFPDFLVFFGFSDDIAVLSAAFAAVNSHITPAHHAAAKRALAEADIDSETRD